MRHLAMRRLAALALIPPLAVSPLAGRASDGAPTGLSALVPPDPEAGAAPDLRARIYVKDLDHLAWIVSSDPELAARTRDLAGRQRRALGVWIGGAVLSTVLFSVGAARAMDGLDTDPGSPTFGERSSTGGEAMMVAAGVTLVVTTLVAGLGVAGGEGLVDIVNDWNLRHPSEPLELERGRPSHAHVHRLAP
jgi:hypothetical protein